jgi:uncharacterized protein YbaP (TraB family)
MRYLNNAIVRVLLTLLLVSLLIGAAYSCGNNATTETKTKAFIWKITSDTTYIYLLGSVLVNNQEIYPLNSVIENAFTSASNLVLKINFNKINQQESDQYVVKYGMYSKEGDVFKKHIPESLYNQLQELFQKFGADIALYDDYKPWVIYNVMSQFILNDLGYKGELSMDSYFLGKAEKSNKNIIEMETLEFQLGLLSSIPDEAIFAAIEYDVENPETEQDLNDIYTTWQKGDIAKMESLVFKAKLAQPEMRPYYDKMYDERNINILNKIEGLLAGKETSFIVVTAGLLLGENGLLNLLKNKGFTVEQLEASD